MAVDMYATDWGECYPAAAYDMGDAGGYNADGVYCAGKWRWHGRRRDFDSPFDPRLGCLAPYIGLETTRVEKQDSDTRSATELRGEVRRLQGIKMCPSFDSYYRSSARYSYEAGAGGYVYNSLFVGSYRGFTGGPFDNEDVNGNWVIDADEQYGDLEALTHGARVPMFRDPQNTIMFTDGAELRYDGTKLYLTETYEATTPDPMLWYAPWGTPNTTGVDSWGWPAANNPTIHFRHGGMANVLWLDGRVTSRRMDSSISGSVSDPANWMSSTIAEFAEYDLGWFGPDDYTLWDYR